MTGLRSNRRDEQSASDSDLFQIGVVPWYRFGIVARGCLVALLILVFAVGPAAAQTQNPVCQDDSQTLANMIEGFVQITVGLGIMGLFVVWQVETVVELFTIDREDLKRFKRHKRRAAKSSVTLVAIGPLFVVAGSAMNLPIAECVDLIPF